MACLWGTGRAPASLGTLPQHCRLVWSRPQAPHPQLLLKGTPGRQGHTAEPASRPGGLDIQGASPGDSQGVREHAGAHRMGVSADTWGPGTLLASPEAATLVLQALPLPSQPTPRADPSGRPLQLSP